MARRDLTSIKELLPSVLAKLARAGESAGALQPVWEQVVGPAIARNATPLLFAGDALVISVTTTGWARELQQREEEIRKRLSAILGDKAVAKLAFRLRA